MLGTMAQFAAASFASSPSLCCCWWCNVFSGAMFACVVCVVVVFASAHYVTLGEFPACCCRIYCLIFYDYSMNLKKSKILGFTMNP
jgi:hypothetical protein